MTQDNASAVDDLNADLALVVQAILVPLKEEDPTKNPQDLVAAVNKLLRFAGGLVVSRAAPDRTLCIEVTWKPSNPSGIDKRHDPRFIASFIVRMIKIGSSICLSKSKPPSSDSRYVLTLVNQLDRKLSSQPDFG